MVWNKTFEPRILHITIERIVLPRCKRRHRPSYHILFKALEKPPIALKICRESRALALKNYAPSFHSTTTLTDTEGTNHTAIYFNPDLDTVHILDNFGHGIITLSQCINQETLQRIKVLAVEFPRHVPPSQFTRYLSMRLPMFERLEIIVLVFGWDAAFTQKCMEDALIEVNDRLRLEGKNGEWKVPAVKVMNPEAFESHS
jgi:hypothetical protein